MERPLQDRTTVWLGAGGVLAASSAVFIGIGVSQRLGNDSLWENGWARAGLVLGLLGIGCLFWTCVLAVAHSNNRHWSKVDTEPTSAVVTWPEAETDLAPEPPTPEAQVAAVISKLERLYGETAAFRLRLETSQSVAQITSVKRDMKTWSARVSECLYDYDSHLSHEWDDLSGTSYPHESDAKILLGFLDQGLRMLRNIIMELRTH